MNRRLKGMTTELLQKLQAYRWKGNIRELKNVIERAVILADSDMLTSEHLPVEFWALEPTAKATANETAISTVERNPILKVLEQTGGNKVEAARKLQIGLTTLQYCKIQEYGL